MAEIRNPNIQTPGQDGGGGGGDLRSMLLPFTLILIAILAFDYFRPKPTETKPAQQTQQQQAASSAASLPAGSVQASAPNPAQAPLLAAVPQVAAALESDTTIENAQYKIVFTNRGAQVKHWWLKHYNNSAGKPLDLVQPQAAARFGQPLSYFTYEAALTQQLNSALYQVTASGAQPSADGHAQAPATNALSFHYAANGLDVVKTVRFDASYVITVESQVKRNGSAVRALVSWPAGLGDMEEFGQSSGGGMGRSASMSRTASQFSWSLNGKQDYEQANKVSGNATFDDNYEYAAVTDLYFAAAFLPDVPSRASVVTLHNTIDLPKSSDDQNSEKKPADLVGLAVGDQSGYTRLRLYAGPKEADVLKSVHTSGGESAPTLKPLIQYGWLTVIAEPLYWAMRYLRNAIGVGEFSWGWAIIILTVFINLCMLPTRLSMMKSSLKMMRIQPKVEAIKRKYANLKMNDPKRAEMNSEMMGLYKTENVNMYGSCLPMLIQMPILYAVYRVFAYAVELRQAHWFWLHDLSMPDPLHALPILVIVSMLIAQLMTPAAGMDPAQRRMMAIMMPVMMGFIMWNLPAGLSLYWGTGNLITIAIQQGINMSPMGKEMHALAEKRAAKKAGGPRTIQGKR